METLTYEALKELDINAIARTGGLLPSYIYDKETDPNFIQNVYGRYDVPRSIKEIYGLNKDGRNITTEEDETKFPTNNQGTINEYLKGLTVYRDQLSSMYTEIKGFMDNLKSYDGSPEQSAYITSIRGKSEARIRNQINIDKSAVAVGLAQFVMTGGANASTFMTSIEAYKKSKGIYDKVMVNFDIIADPNADATTKREAGTMLADGYGGAMQQQMKLGYMNLISATMQSMPQGVMVLDQGFANLQNLLNPTQAAKSKEQIAQEAVIIDSIMRLSSKDRNKLFIDNPDAGTFFTNWFKSPGAANDGSIGW